MLLKHKEATLQLLSLAIIWRVFLCLLCPAVCAFSVCLLLCCSSLCRCRQRCWMAGRSCGGWRLGGWEVARLAWVASCCLGGLAGWVGVWVVYILSVTTVVLSFGWMVGCLGGWVGWRRWVFVSHLGWATGWGSGVCGSHNGYSETFALLWQTNDNGEDDDDDEDVDG